MSASRTSSALLQAGKTLGRLSPGLAAAAAGAGAALAPESASAVKCIPTASGGVFCSPEGVLTPPRTGGAVAQAWALGTLTEAVQPDGTTACDIGHVCDLVARSNGLAPGSGITIQREFANGDYVFPGNLPFVLDEVIDYSHALPNGVGGACYPATGTLAVTVAATGTVVLDFQGQACQLGNSETRALLFSGGYIGDRSSTGMFANAEAIGTFNIENPSGLADSLTRVKVSFSGQLLLQGEPPP